MLVISYAGHTQVIRLHQYLGKGNKDSLNYDSECDVMLVEVTFLVLSMCAFIIVDITLYFIIVDISLWLMTRWTLHDRRNSYWIRKKTLYPVSDDNQVFPRSQSTGNMSWKRICMHAAAVWIVINGAKIKHSEHTMKVHLRLFHLHDSFLYDKDNPKLINATGHDWIISCKFINIIIISLSISRVVNRNILYWTNHIVVDVDEEAKRAF